MILPFCIIWLADCAELTSRLCRILSAPDVSEDADRCFRFLFYVVRIEIARLHGPALLRVTKNIGDQSHQGRCLPPLEAATGFRHADEFAQSESVRVYSADSGAVPDEPVNRSSSKTTRFSNSPFSSASSFFRAASLNLRLADRIFFITSRFASGKKSITSSRSAVVACSMASPEQPHLRR